MGFCFVLCGRLCIVLILKKRRIIGSLCGGHCKGFCRGLVDGVGMEAVCAQLHGELWEIFVVDVVGCFFFFFQLWVFVGIIQEVRVMDFEVFAEFLLFAGVVLIGGVDH